MHLTRPLQYIGSGENFLTQTKHSDRVSDGEHHLTNLYRSSFHANKGKADIFVVESQEIMILKTRY